MTHQHHDGMEALFDEAIETNVALAIIDRLMYAWLTNRMTGGELKVGLEVFEKQGTREAAKAELDSLSDDDRGELGALVVPWVNNALSEAVLRLCHVARKLGFDPKTLDPKHVALIGAMLIGRRAPMLRKA